jgi:hypothetical protein
MPNPVTTAIVGLASDDFDFYARCLRKVFRICIWHRSQCTIPMKENAANG